MEMAQLFPHVHFRGFDIGTWPALSRSRSADALIALCLLVPIATRYPPRNVQFELTDVNTSVPLRWSDGTFDVVNARFVDMAVSRTVRVLRA